VGTRKPSAAAMTQTYDVAFGLGCGGLSVVSGLALGIDAMAHRGNIEGGAATFAVLGSAVDEVFPTSNRGLAHRVLDTGGALLSEYPPGTGPLRWHFPARNRIIAGLSRGVLVVEAPEKSGALITARCALDQNRDVWVASAGVAAEGTGRLVRDGAEVVRSASDVFGMWGMSRPAGEDAALSPVAALAAALGVALEGG